MKKLILSTLLVAGASMSYAQFTVIPPDSDDIYWNRGRVGIGLSAPKAKLDVHMATNYMYKEETGFRLSYPIPSLINDPGAPPVINTSVFEIRQKAPLGSNYITKMVVTRSGNVGIGVPLSEPLLEQDLVVISDNQVNKIDLHVKGFSLIDGDQASLLLGRNTGSKYGEWGIEYNEHVKGLNFWKPSGSNNFGNYFMFISDKGKVGIGVDPSELKGDYNLYVSQGILAERVKVALRNTTDWADYVFKSDYELMNLSDVEAYIRSNGHLPGIPAAEEVKESGIDVALMDAKLLEKIEELTLYMIELKKENAAIKLQLETLKK
jgi:hypothetical protein